MLMGLLGYYDNVETYYSHVAGYRNEGSQIGRRLTFTYSVELCLSCQRQPGPTMYRMYQKSPDPWPVSYSYTRMCILCAFGSCRVSSVHYDSRKWSIGTICRVQKLVWHSKKKKIKNLNSMSYRRRFWRCTRECHVIRQSSSSSSCLLFRACTCDQEIFSTHRFRLSQCWKRTRSEHTNPRGT